MRQNYFDEDFSKFCFSPKEQLPREKLTAHMITVPKSIEVMDVEKKSGQQKFVFVS